MCIQACAGSVLLAFSLSNVHALMLQEPPSPQGAAAPSNPDEPSAEYVEAGVDHIFLNHTC